MKAKIFLFLVSMFVSQIYSSEPIKLDVNDHFFINETPVSFYVEPASFDIRDLIKIDDLYTFYSTASNDESVRKQCFVVAPEIYHDLWPMQAYSSEGDFCMSFVYNKGYKAKLKDHLLLGTITMFSINPKKDESLLLIIKNKSNLLSPETKELTTLQLEVIKRNNGVEIARGILEIDGSGCMAVDGKIDFIASDRFLRRTN